jgi:hypothetical protein
MSRYGESERSWYDTAQICLNGHHITSTAHSSPEFCKQRCPKCGEKTITNCPACEEIIQGFCHIPGVIHTSSGETPSFCHACGKPYPWTLSRLQAAQSLADEMDSLTDAEKITLKSTLDDLIRDTPQSAVAVVRFKKLAAKGSSQVGQAFRDILVDIVSETVRKGLWGA